MHIKMALFLLCSLSQRFKLHRGKFFWNSICTEMRLWRKLFHLKGILREPRHSKSFPRQNGICAGGWSTLNCCLGNALFVRPVCAPWDKTCVIRLHFLDESLSPHHATPQHIYTSFQNAFSGEWAVHVNGRACARSLALRNKTLFDVLSSTKKHILPRYIKHTRGERDRYWTPSSANANTCYRLRRRIFAVEKPSSGCAFPARTKGKSCACMLSVSKRVTREWMLENGFHASTAAAARLFVSEKWRIRSICAFPAFNWWRIHIIWQFYVHTRTKRADVWSTANFSENANILSPYDKYKSLLHPYHISGG